jgi:hypothetical protein
VTAGGDHLLNFKLHIEPNEGRGLERKAYRSRPSRNFDHAICVVIGSLDWFARFKKDTVKNSEL